MTGAHSFFIRLLNEFCDKRIGHVQGSATSEEMRSGIARHH